SDSHMGRQPMILWIECGQLVEQIDSRSSGMFHVRSYDIETVAPCISKQDLFPITRQHFGESTQHFAPERGQLMFPELAESLKVTEQKSPDLSSCRCLVMQSAGAISSSLVYRGPGSARAYDHRWQIAPFPKGDTCRGSSDRSGSVTLNTIPYRHLMDICIEKSCPDDCQSHRDPIGIAEEHLITQILSSSGQSDGRCVSETLLESPHPIITKRPDRYVFELGDRERKREMNVRAPRLQSFHKNNVGAGGKRSVSETHAKTLQ